MADDGADRYRMTGDYGLSVSGDATGGGGVGSA
jgi:hypothetical protein